MPNNAKSDGLCTSGFLMSAYTTIATIHTNNFKKEEAYTPLTKALGLLCICLVTSKKLTTANKAITMLPIISAAKSYPGAAVLSQ